MRRSHYLLMTVLVVPLALAQQSPPQEPISNARSIGLALAEDAATPPTEATPPTPEQPTDDTATLLDASLPSDRELLLANNELLAKNAELSRRVDTLTTQVNVLVQERSGQLYVYGAMTAIFCVILGFVFAKLTTKRRW